MTAITKQSLATIRKDIDAALEAVLKKHNLSLAPYSITYNADGFKATMNFGSKDAIGDVNPVYARELLKHGLHHGLTRSHINQKFVFPGLGECTFTGLKNARTAVFNSPKGPRRANVEMVVHLLGVNAKVA